MVDVANRSYWTRYWVIQEFLLGQDVTLFCGQFFIGWRQFQDGVWSQSESHMGVDIERLHDLRIAGLGRLHKLHVAKTAMNRTPFKALPLISSRHAESYPQLQQALYDLLLQYRHCQCQDPRDRVFSLLGLIHVGEKLNLERYFPDYSLSFEAVAIITLEHVITHGPTDLDTIETMDSIFQALHLSSLSHNERRVLLSIGNMWRLWSNGLKQPDEYFKHAKTLIDPVTGDVRSDANFSIQQYQYGRLCPPADVEQTPAKRLS